MSWGREGGPSEMGTFFRTKVFETKRISQVEEKKKASIVNSTTDAREYFKGLIYQKVVSVSLLKWHCILCRLHERVISSVKYIFLIENFIRYSPLPGMGFIQKWTSLVDLRLGQDLVITFFA